LYSAWGGGYADLTPRPVLSVLPAVRTLFNRTRFRSQQRLQTVDRSQIGPRIEEGNRRQQTSAAGAQFSESRCNNWLRLTLQAGICIWPIRTSSTKPEAIALSSEEDRATATAIMYRTFRTDRQTDRHTGTKIAILRTPPGAK